MILKFDRNISVRVIQNPYYYCCFIFNKCIFLTVLTFLCHSKESFRFPFLFILWKNLMEDFAEMGRGALVDYLAMSGLATGILASSGRKSELVALAYSAFVSNMPIIYTEEEISTNLKKEYTVKLKRHNIKKDCLSVTSDCLDVDEVTKCPSVNLGKIFN